MIHPILDRYYTKLFFRDRVFSLFFVAGLLAHAAQWILLFLAFDTIYSPDKAYITLHYKIIFGTDFVAQWFSIFLVPLVGLAVFIINALISRTLYNIDKRLAIACMATAFFVNAVLLWALYLLLQVNLY